MIADVWNTLREYLKRTALWPWMEPLLLVCFLYTGVIVSAFQYIQWRYGAALSLPLFLGSYIFRGVSIVFIALLIIYLILVSPLWAANSTTAARWQRAFGKRALLTVKFALIVVVATVAMIVWRELSPHRNVSSIRVMIAPAGAFSAIGNSGRPQTANRARVDMSKHRALLVYLLFELNRIQKTWHFQADFKPLTKLRGPEFSYCDRENSPIFCYAQQHYADASKNALRRAPLLVIASDPLSKHEDESLFWLHSGAVSVVTTRDWEREVAPSLLDYLVYTITLQAIITHLDMHCPGHGFTPFDSKEIRPGNTERAVKRTAQELDDVVSGNVFELAPRAEALKAAILAGRLGYDDEQVLLNCFGLGYLQTASALLRLEWLHSERVKGNLFTVYGVKEGILPNTSKLN